MSPVPPPASCRLDHRAKRGLRDDPIPAARRGQMASDAKQPHAQYKTAAGGSPGLLIACLPSAVMVALVALVSGLIL